MTTASPASYSLTRRTTSCLRSTHSPPQTSGLRHCSTAQEAKMTAVSSTRSPPPRPEASGTAASYPYPLNGGPTSWINQTLGPHSDG